MFTALVSLIVGLAVAAVGIGVGVSQVEAQKEMNQQNIDANKELNEKSIEESEKAYQRSTPSNQIKEYIKAGLSEQQAKTLIAGTGATSTYTPAALTSEMSGTGVGGILSGIQNIGGGISSGLGALQNFATDAHSDNGGMYGTMLTEDIQGTILEHADSIPEDARSFYGFTRWSKSSAAPNWASDLVGSKEWTKAVRSVSGNRALNDFFSNMNTYSSDDARLLGLYKQNQINAINLSLRQVELDQAQLQYARSSIEWAYDAPNMNLFSQVKYEQARKSLLTASLDNDFLSNQEYRDKYIMKCMTDMDQQALYATCLRAIYEGKADWLHDPNNAAMIGIYSAFKDAGVTQTEAGTILASLEASGVNLSSPIRAFIETIKEKIDPQAILTFPGKVSEAVSEYFDEKSEEATEFKNKIVSFIEVQKDSADSYIQDYVARISAINNDDSLPTWQKKRLIWKEPLMRK